MANNLFISYDLHGPNRDYKPVFAAIFALGNTQHLELSQFFVSTNISAADAAKRVWASMQANDKLLVIDAKNNNAAWYGLKQATSDFVRNHWTP